MTMAEREEGRDRKEEVVESEEVDTLMERT